MNDKIKKVLNMITANGMRELTDERLNQFAIEICHLQKQSIVNELENINYESAYHIFDYSQNIAE
jgi:hypothetical protein